MANAFDRPVPTLAQQTQYLADDVNAAGRADPGYDREAPIATWNAFSPGQLADLITGVTRSDPEFGKNIVLRMIHGENPFEFGTQRRDPSGALIGGALWRAERAGVSSFALHLLQSEPEGTA